MKKIIARIFSQRLILLLLIFFELSILTSAIPTYDSKQETPIWTEPLKNCWSYPSENYYSQKVASDNESTILPLPFGKIESINNKNKYIQWNVEFGGEITSNLLTNLNDIFFTNQTINETNRGVILRSIDITSGITNWKIEGFPFTDESRLFLEKNLLVLISTKGHLKSFDIQNGNLLRETDIKRVVSTVLVSDNRIFIGTTEKKIIVLNIENFEVQQEIKVTDIPTDIFLNNQNTLIWGNKKGILNSSNIITGKTLWLTKFGAQISSVEQTGSALLVSSLDNFVYFIDFNKGNSIWKRRFSSRIAGKPFIKDNVAVLGATGDSTVFFLELTNGNIINYLSLSDANYLVASPFIAGGRLILPTLKGLYAFSNNCVET